MKEEPFQAPWHFGGLPEDISTPGRSRGWLRPIPDESTASDGAGPSSVTGSSMASSGRGCGIHTIMPPVGTAQPGGISWERMRAIARAVCRKPARVPAFDVVELAPIPGSRAPGFPAAELVPKRFSCALAKGGKSKDKRRYRNG